MHERHRFEREIADLEGAQVDRLMAEPARAPVEEVRDRPHIMVVDDAGQPLSAGKYVFHQGKVSEGDSFNAQRQGRAYFSKIDPSQPFVFEVCDRVCSIRYGAFLNPDDTTIQYGGTSFDWALVRDNKDPDKDFWPHYQREMDFAVQMESIDTTLGSSMTRFLQHEHITRRPIQIAKPLVGQPTKVQIRATPAHIRVGPFVRYADHGRALIWLETVTPCMVKVCSRLSGGTSQKLHYASTIRVGGRHFAAVDVAGLAPDTFYDYTVELAPLPAADPIPVDQKAFVGLFPTLTVKVADDIKKQLRPASLRQTEWMTFRTLRQKYDKQLKFATGSCRWYPGDKKANKDWGPDMLDGLGTWLQMTPKEKWPHFLFFGGDQIYSDEIGDDHFEMLVKGRFASRVPGPADPKVPVRDRLIDGAWAGRFAHRFKGYKDPDVKFVDRIKTDINALDESYRRYPELKDIYHRYPNTGLADKEKRILANQLMFGLTWGLGGKMSDQKVYDKALALVKATDKLNLNSGSYRAFLPHWKAGSHISLRRNPMGRRFLSHNFLLWEVPNFEPLLPALTDGVNAAIVQPDVRGHRPAYHAADFAEYSYLYERAWTTSRSVRVLLAQVPTFLMFDDHEVTDDWNFDTGWARMLHNQKDAFRMWPKTLTDGLAAYWVYQGWCNQAPSQWKAGDLRVKAMTDAQQTGTDALPALRRCIYKACFTPEPNDPKATYQTGLTLDWHYRLPFDPPFLVPDCRTRRQMVPGDEALRIIDHDGPAKERPLSRTIDVAQLTWMRDILINQWRGGPGAFIALSTPLLMQKKVMGIMMKPETTAEAWDKENLPSIIAAAAGSAFLGIASDALIRVFRRVRDLEHMIRDKSWTDLWQLAADMRSNNSPVKSLVLVSGDVHHSYCMTANLPGGGRPKPELVQITCSGLQTTIRKSFEKTLAEDQGVWSFDVGKYRLVPGFVRKNDTGEPDLILYENTVAMVDVTLGAEVDVVVTYHSGSDKHFYRYTSGAAYMKGGEPAIRPRPPHDQGLSPLRERSAFEREVAALLGAASFKPGDV